MTVQVLLESPSIIQPTAVSRATPMNNSVKQHFTSRSFFENLVGLQRDYNYDPPLLALFVLLHAHDTYPADIPLPLAKIIITSGAWLGRSLGYKAHYKEYTTQLL